MVPAAGPLGVGAGELAADSDFSLSFSCFSKAIAWARSSYFDFSSGGKFLH